MSKKITTLAAVKMCLSAYYFQEGAKANRTVIVKIENLIKTLEEENNEDSKKTFC